VRVLQNLGSLSQIKRGKQGCVEYILNKGREVSRVYRIQEGVQVEETQVVELDKAIERVWAISKDGILVQTFEGSQFVVDLNSMTHREWTAG